jgi:predicted Ser/Thr protein kinase
VYAGPDAEFGYEILGEIHRGGQGVVHKAIQKATKRTVAVKMLLHGPYASERERHYFEREVELAASLRHPNIVTVYESGVTQGRYYLAMEYVDGLPLDQYVARNDLTRPALMDLLAKACDAVAYAHQHGVIHRDLKPSNILVDGDGQPHIVDFGLAKATVDRPGAQASSAVVSTTGQLIGTLAYMSPEQASGQATALDVRTDVYSVGVIMYQLLTGQFPYNVRGNLLEVARAIQEVEPVRPSRIVRGLDSDVQAIVLKALDKDPRRRYQSATELHHDLVCWLKGLPIVARSASSLYLVRKLMVRHWYATAVIGLLIVIIVGFGLVSLNFYRQAQTALAREARSDRASLAATRGLDQSAETLTIASRQHAMAWILLAWHQGRTAEAKALSQRLPAGCREQAAAAFLLDPRPIDAKVPAFREALRGTDDAFTAYIIGEHHLRDGDRTKAIEAYKQSVQINPDGWFAARARDRLTVLVDADPPRSGSIDTQDQRR